MAEFPTYEQMAKNVAEKALDEFLYHGKSIREWMKIIVEQEPKTESVTEFADRCRECGKMRKGHWIAIENEEMDTIGYFCSICDLPMETEEKTKYCPNCGAKMIESQKERDKE